MILQNPPLAASLNKLALLFNNSSNGQVIRGVEVLLTAHLPNNISIAFGKLVSDHAGYVCFDLAHAQASLQPLLEQHLRAHGSAPMPDPTVPRAAVERDEAGRDEAAPQPAQKPLAIIATLRTIPEQQIDILRHGFSVVRDALLATINLPASALAAPYKGNGLVAIQRPSLTDWTISPSSFAINPAFFIGQDQCENLYPANFATQEFRFHQLLRADTEIDREARHPILHGWALEYQTTWVPLGHTLGKLVYSLPLAPGEITNIAVVDWSRKSLDSRFDDLIISEKLNHNTHRDRTISETVDATLDEWQRGGSVMGGVAGSMSYGAGSTSMGASAAIGGGYSTSSADRHVTASTVQQLSDGFAQASSSMRELRSTVVIQSAQQEHVEAKTRVVANYNHAHALTILYYEVLRHYRVTTQFNRTRRCLMVSYADRMVNFDDDSQIDQHQYVLKHVLLEKALSPAFDLISKLVFYKGTVITGKLPSDYKFSLFKIRIKTGDDGTDSDVRILLLLKNNTLLPLTHDESDDSDKTVLDSGEDDFENGSDRTYLLSSKQPIRWGDLNQLKIDLDGSGEWKIDSVTLTGVSEEGDSVLFNATVNTSISNISISLPVKAPSDKLVQTADGKLPEADKFKIFRLKQHLMANQLYYNRAIWLLEDPNERARRFANIQYEGKPLLDLVDNRPIDILGDLVAFPSNNQKPDMPVFEASKSEKLMSLPTRGVFAEAKLGHCSASEIIDNTRFWDWQTSPIPEKAPQIAPASTESRNVSQNTAPTQMPSAIVNIVNPSPAPDPTGMAGAMNLLGQADIFRNMSMSKEVGELLGKLASNSISMADAAKKATEISQGTASGGGGAGAGGGGAAAGGAKSGANPGSPQQLMDWTNAIKNSNLSPEQKAKLTAALVDNMTGGAVGSPASNAGFHVTPAVPFVMQPSPMTCWAAAATMLKSWKENASLTITEVVDQAGPLYRDLFDGGKGLNAKQLLPFFENLNFGYEAPANHAIEFYIKLLKKYGPLWMTLDAAQAANVSSPHAYILVGYKGDGTQANTRFILMEPSKPGETEYSFTEFLQKFEEMATELGSGQAMFLQIAYNLNPATVGALPPYDRNAALVYAQTYWDRTCSDNYLLGQSQAHYFPNNPKAEIVGEPTEDCTHFVSNCIGMSPKDSLNQITGGGLYLQESAFFPNKVPQAYGFTMPKLLLDYLKLTKKIKYLDNQGKLQDDLYYHEVKKHASLTVPFADPHGDIIFYSVENTHVKPGSAFTFKHAALVVGIDPATNNKLIACHTRNRFGLPIDDVDLTDDLHPIGYFVYARVIW